MTDGQGLTSREREIAAYVAEGLTNREIADRLVVSVRTIDFHLRNTFKKLGVRSRTELAVTWVRGGAQRDRQVGSMQNDMEPSVNDD